jgi:hypothetical protein
MDQHRAVVGVADVLEHFDQGSTSWPSTGPT